MTISDEEKKARKRAYDLAYYQRNSERIKARTNAAAPGWRKRNPAKYLAIRYNRVKSLRQATPKWLNEAQWEEMNQRYLLARECRVLTGDLYHVDHVVPIKGKNVCGLHVPWNLQILPQDLNDKKGNEYV